LLLPAAIPIIILNHDHHENPRSIRSAKAFSAVVDVITNNPKQRACRNKTTGIFFHVPAEHFMGRKHGISIPACRRYALCRTDHLHNPFRWNGKKKQSFLPTMLPAGASFAGAGSSSPIYWIHRAVNSTTNFL